MVEAPEKIWLLPAEGTLLQPGTTQQRDPWWDFDGAVWATETRKDADVEYVRSDIAERQIAELRAENARLRVLPLEDEVERVVKPLEWVEKSDGHWIAKNPFGECWIKSYVGRTDFTLYAPGHYGPGNNFPTLDAAKAAAQADYERRILSTLSQPHPADERMVERLKAKGG